MNVVKSIYIANPHNEEDECAQMIIDDVNSTFTMLELMNIDQTYTLSFWIRANAEGLIYICGTAFNVTAQWTRHVMTFNADDADMNIIFDVTGTYYIYHPKLEIGTKATDWTPAVGDMATEEKVDSVQDSVNETQDKVNEVELNMKHAQSMIEQLSDTISMLITDENGASLMTQTSTGWTFSMAGIQDALDSTSTSLDELLTKMGDTDSTISILQTAVENLENTSEYVHIGTFGDEPCIELGESDTAFKLLITNTRVMFVDDTDIPTYITKDGLHTDRIEVESELCHGELVWATRANGNYGLTWKGADE